MINKEKCCGCSGCFNICSLDCIEMVEDKSGSLYPQVNKDKCINCGKCDRVCPSNDTQYQEWLPVFAWGGYVLDEKIRRESSSGGVFSLLAVEIINKGGIVYGAALMDDYSDVHHIKIESVDELYKLRGSKYVQSNINTIYRDIKEELIVGRAVLFSGTPCQIDALNRFLGKDFENLVTVEVICHGLPVKSLFRKYIAYMKKKMNSDIRGIFFRDENGGVNS